MVLALFDFDCTLTTRDTLRDFARYYLGRRRYWLVWLRLFPLLLGFKCRLVSHNRAKRAFVRACYRGESLALLERAGRDYCRKRLPELMDQRMLLRLRWHREMGHEVAVVTASLAPWVKPWCEDEGVILISTELDIVELRVTGELVSGNCYGENKLAAVCMRFSLDRYQKIYAYGDSRADLQMLELADEAWYRGRQVKVDGAGTAMEGGVHV